MNHRVIAASVGGLFVAASVGTAVALPSRPTTHSGAFSFVAVQSIDHHFSNGHSVSTDKEVRSGHIIGTDTLACIIVNKTTGKCEVAASYTNGQVFGTFRLNFKTGALSGKVTGGTRHFQGAVGTITGNSVSATREKVTITYQAP